MTRFSLYSLVQDLQIGSARAKPVYISPPNQRDSECSVPELCVKLNGD